MLYIAIAISKRMDKGEGEGDYFPTGKMRTKELVARHGGKVVAVRSLQLLRKVPVNPSRDLPGEKTGPLQAEPKRRKVAEEMTRGSTKYISFKGSTTCANEALKTGSYRWPPRCGKRKILMHGGMSQKQFRKLRANGGGFQKW